MHERGVVHWVYAIIFIKNVGSAVASTGLPHHSPPTYDLISSPFLQDLHEM